MKYVAVSAIWLGMGVTLAAMAHYGVFAGITGGGTAVFAILFGGIVAVLGTLAATR